MEQNKQWQSPFGFLTIATIVMAVTFSAWNALLNNFAVEAAQFNGANMGMLQSLREIPGLLAFTAVFILLVLIGFLVSRHPFYGTFFTAIKIY